MTWHWRLRSTKLDKRSGAQSLSHVDRLQLCLSSQRGTDSGQNQASQACDRQGRRAGLLGWTNTMDEKDEQDEQDGQAGYEAGI